MIIVDKVQSKDRSRHRTESGGIGHIAERAVTFVVEQPEARLQSDHDVRPAVVVIVAGDTADGTARDGEIGAGGRIREAVSHVVVEYDFAVGAYIQHQKVGSSIVVIIEKAGSRAESCLLRFSGSTEQAGIGTWHGNECNRNRPGRGAGRNPHLLGERILALISVRGSDGRPKLFLREFLESLQLLARFLTVPQSLVGIRQAELRRDMERIDLERPPVAGNGKIQFPGALVERSQEIVRVRIAGIELNDPAERGQSLFGFVKLPAQQAEVEPGPRVVRLLFDGFFEHLPRHLVPLEVEQCNAFVQPGCEQTGVEGAGLLEILQRRLASPLVHVRHAEIVEPDGFCGLSRSVWGLFPVNEGRARPRPGPQQS